MDPTQGVGRHERWAHLRFGVVGPLLASPPERGQLRAALEELAERTWQHPITGQPVRFGVSTIERWYYRALNGRDPVVALRRKERSDRGRQQAVGTRLGELIRAEHARHPSWSYRLHYDNLAVRVESSPELGPLPSYSSLCRWMRAQGLQRRRRTESLGPGQRRALARLQARETRSYEAEHVGALWHVDFHHGSLKVLTAEGRWVRPLLLALLDDRSRLCCHAQWYLTETAESLVHGLVQALLKRDLPRALMSDNGSAMIATETRAGLLRLSILQETTLPYSPHQNAKQEVFWARVEGRLMAMLEGQPDLSLSVLNEATQAWVEMEYHRRTHTETGQSPLERWLDGPSVMRPCPRLQQLQLAFTVAGSRAQRKSDGTVSIEGTRFEVPSRFRHLHRVDVRYARWDLRHVWLTDEHTGEPLARLYPLDKARNADGHRRPLQQPAEATPDEPTGMAPLLRELIHQYAATGLPPAYIARDEDPDQESS